ncbi:MAG: hypothetical protein FRX49_05553 [Trebouxia sp. A1-2]|nr:MAG: hypothetical protein FRX49_05553 [Trebouxia sp. A1-2]
MPHLVYFIQQQHRVTYTAASYSLQHVDVTILEQLLIPKALTEFCIACQRGCQLASFDVNLFETRWKGRSRTLEMELARLVLPVPGGPTKHRIGARASAPLKRRTASWQKFWFTLSTSAGGFAALILCMRADSSSSSSSSGPLAPPLNTPADDMPYELLFTNLLAATTSAAALLVALLLVILHQMHHMCKLMIYHGKYEDLDGREHLMSLEGPACSTVTSKNFCRPSLGASSR